MRGNSIQKASECLGFFVKSLSANSYFNEVRFGSKYEKLFETSVLYDDQTSEKDAEYAKNLEANLRGTNIYMPLENIYSEKCKNGQRQIFIMTDGKVKDVERVLDLISSHSNENLDAIKSMTGANVDTINEINLPDKDDEIKCLATILAIAAMRIKSPDDKNSWIMIEQKTLGWLKEKLPDVNIEQVISSIQTLVK